MAKRNGPLSTDATLGLLLFIAFFDNFTQIPLIAPYASRLGADPVTAGWIVGMYSFTNMLGNVVAGFVLDRFGRRGPLAAGLLWAGLGVGLYGCVPSPAGLLAARGFHGLGGSVLVPAIFTLAADTMPPARRSFGMGRVGAVIGLAAVIGPAAAGLISEALGPSAVFATVFVVMTCGALLARTLPETLPSAQRVPGRTTPNSEGLFFRRTAFRIINSVGFALAFALGSLTLLLPWQMQQTGFGAGRIGAVFSAFAAAAATTMWTRGKNRTRSAFAFAFFLVSLAFASFASFSRTSTSAGIAIGMIFFGVGFGLTYPVLNAHIATLHRPEERGRAYGVFYACFSLGIVVASPLAGGLMNAVPVPVAYALLSAAAFVGALLLSARRSTFPPDAPPGDPGAPHLGRHPTPVRFRRR